MNTNNTPITVDELWQSFKEDALGLEISPEVLRMLEQTFKAGAFSYNTVLVTRGGAPNPQHAQLLLFEILQATCKEQEEFVCKIAQEFKSKISTN